MGSRKQTKGFCKYCGKEYTKSGMLRHLASCKKRRIRLEENLTNECGYFQLVITGKYSKAYWLIVEIKENATLKELDKFIRDIWVECCGHLSSFEINGDTYDSYPSTGSFWGKPAKSMNYKLKQVFSVGDTATYEYDFGSTTELVISVHSHRLGRKEKEKVIILSRNNPPEILCGQCEKNKATLINVMGMYDENPFWCEACLRESYHDSECDEEYDEEDFDEFYDMEYMSQICNSPRMGVCGYEGSTIYPDQFQPDEV